MKLIQHASQRTDLASPVRDNLTVATLNIGDERNPRAVVSEFRSIRGLAAADIIFLQEAEHGANIPPIVSRLAEALDMHIAYGAEEVLKPATAKALTTLCRFPLRDVELIELPFFQRMFNPQRRIALAATIETPFGSVRTFNVHLDTRINAKQRLQQLRPVLDAAKTFNGPVLIGGDFNTADVRWINHLVPVPFLQRHSRRIRKAFETDGFHTPFRSTAFTMRGYPARLDWIFLRGLRALTYSVNKVAFSNHRALCAHVIPISQDVVGKVPV